MSAQALAAEPSTIPDLCGDFTSGRSQRVILETMQKRLAAIDKAKSTTNVAGLRKGDKAFVDFKHIRPGQVSLSYKGMCHNLIEKSPDKVRLPLLNDDGGRSILPLTKAKWAVLGRDDQVILIDGHHTATVSILSGAQSMPVEIVDDLRAVPAAEYWAKMVQKNYAYLKNAKGETFPETAKSFADLRNDPLRGFFDQAVVEIVKNVPKTATDSAKFKVIVTHSQPVALRFDQEVQPYFEFLACAVVARDGFEVAQDNDGPLDGAKVEELRRRLAKLAPLHPEVFGKGFYLVPTPTLYNAIPYSTLDKRFSLDMITFDIH